ncbi:MAG: potassium-transporting ATPase subunit C [Oscillospiraceae bacterium]|nr:potassium-transporting ATPase subunit C [Oscillospiraceae bacterium]
MKTKPFYQAAKFLLLATLVCGVLYTGFVTLFAAVFFPAQANGSIITVNGKAYGSELLGQPYQDDAHLWGRVANLTVTKAADGTPLLYAAPSNMHPTGDEYAALIAQRVQQMREANPARANDAVPVELVTASASGLDPHISPAAAEYQVPRVAAASGKTPAQVRAIVAQCTQGRYLGVFGENRVNVLRVNLMLDGIL